MEDSDENTSFFHTVKSDADAYANFGTPLLKRQIAALSAKFKYQVAEKIWLGVVVCMPVTASAASQSTTPVGCLSLIHHQAGHEHPRSSNTSIDIMASYQRQGYGSGVIEWALDWGFLVAGLH